MLGFSFLIAVVALVLAVVFWFQGQSAASVVKALREEADSARKEGAAAPAVAVGRLGGAAGAARGSAHRAGAAGGIRRQERARGAAARAGAEGRDQEVQGSRGDEQPRLPRHQGRARADQRAARAGRA